MQFFESCRSFLHDGDRNRLRGLFESLELGGGTTAKQQKKDADKTTKQRCEQNSSITLTIFHLNTDMPQIMGWTFAFMDKCIMEIMNVYR